MGRGIDDGQLAHDASYHLGRPRLGLIISGAAVSLVPYAFTAYFNFLAVGRTSLYVPVLGPFIRAADPDLPDEGRALFIANGVVQTAGLVMVIVGALAKRKYVLLQAEADDGAWRATLAPSAGAMNGAAFQLDFHGL